MDIPKDRNNATLVMGTRDQIMGLNFILKKRFTNSLFCLDGILFYDLTQLIYLKLNVNKLL